MNTTYLNQSDVRAIVRLLGQTCATKGTITQKKHFLMKGLCRLLDIQAWGWVHAVEMVPGKLPVYVAYLHGGFTEQKLAAFLKIQIHPDMAHLSTAICQGLAGQTVPWTRTLQQIVPVEEFLHTDVAKEWAACDIYPRLLSFHPLADGTFSGVGIYRSCDKPLFTEREAKIVHIVLSEVPWLHDRHGAAAERAIDVPQLSRHKRLVFELLLQGLSRKAIADTMNISINTVAGYVKEIYAFFAVTSQAELINRFFLGNGGDEVKKRKRLSYRVKNPLSKRPDRSQALHAKRKPRIRQPPANQTCN